jgi:hypothetical protein
MREYLPHYLTGGRLDMLHVGKDQEEISRRSFLRLGFAGVSGAVLLFLSGCLGEEEDEEDEDDD